MMKCHKPLLYVSSRAALFRAADKDAYPARIDIVKEFLLLLFGVRVVYERYLLAWNTLLYELVFEVIVGIEVCPVHIVLKP